MAFLRDYQPLVCDVTIHISGTVGTVEPAQPCHRCNQRAAAAALGVVGAKKSGREPAVVGDAAAPDQPLKLQPILRGELHLLQ